MALSWLVAALFLVGCGHAEPKTDAPLPLDHHFSISVGAKTVAMQLAIAMPEMQRGLMGRRDLGADEGMLFVYNTPQKMSFWMRNTPSPLDIGFFDTEGVLREIYQMQPFDETPVQSHRDDLQYALEMNQGWFERAGVKVGSPMDLGVLAAAVKARGFPVRGFRGLSESAGDAATK